MYEEQIFICFIKCPENLSKLCTGSLIKFVDILIPKFCSKFKTVLNMD